MIEIKKEYKILDIEGVIKRFDIKYERKEYCIVPNVRLYRYNKINYMVHDKYFKRTRDCNFVIGKIYYLNYVEYTKAKMMLDAYYMKGVNTDVQNHKIKIVTFENVQDIVSLNYKTRYIDNIETYVLKDEFAKRITKDKHKRVKAYALKENFEEVSKA